MLNNYINEKYLSVKSIKSLKSKFIHGKTFPHLIFKDFFNERFINEVLNELKKENFEHKESDLFSFMQTNDLAFSSHNVVGEFYNLLNSKYFKQYLQKITGISAFGKIDCSGFIYQSKDYLLPHDDELEGRKIAYVVNLSEGFKNNNEGSLDLFDSKSNHPKKIIKSIIPSFNTLVLFKVSKISLHQISEVCVDKDRVSIGGWFHG